MADSVQQIRWRSCEMSVLIIIPVLETFLLIYENCWSQVSFPVKEENIETTHRSFSFMILCFAVTLIRKQYVEQNYKS